MVFVEFWFLMSSQDLVSSIAHVQELGFVNIVG